MKRLSVIAVAIAAVMLFAIPAMAVDLDLSGEYRARGFYNDNTDLDDAPGASNAWMDMRFRLQGVFQVNDTLKVTTRIDAVDNNDWGNESGAVTFDRAYLTANFDMFDLHVGRMAGGTYGTTFLDTEGDADRIKLVKKMDPYTLMFIYQKSTEGDKDLTLATAQADADKDVYYGSVQYKAEEIDTGILVYHVNDTTPSATLSRKYMVFNPYLRGTFGPVRVEAEIGHKTGDYEDNDTTADVDYDSWAYHLNAGMDVGPAAVSIGYAHTDGEDTGNDKTAYGFGGEDWMPLLIATSDESDITLGGFGNLNSANGAGVLGGSAVVSDLGYDVYYITAACSPMENVTLSAILAKAQADETEYARTQAGLSKLDDDIGTEFDISAKVKLMDNLTYNITLAYFDPGDMWKDISSTLDDSTYSIFHALVVTF